MSEKAAALLWNRMHIDVPDGVVDIDTGLTQPNRSFPSYSPGEPSLGVTASPPGPGPGSTPASRIQVIPLSPIPNWDFVTHGEPYFDPATNTIHVQFSGNTNTTLNVLFWDPHSILGPGDADTYNVQPQ